MYAGHNVLQGSWVVSCRHRSKLAQTIDAHTLFKAPRFLASLQTHPFVPESANGRIQRSVDIV